MTPGRVLKVLGATVAFGGATPTRANCIPPPVDGNLLQVMPWPVFHHMTDHQTRPSRNA